MSSLEMEKLNPQRIQIFKKEYDPDLLWLL